ncbi:MULTISPECIES: SDR family oxidoreductase [unclassified Mesorhizobium]|uniref:SDR family oxidoreductase n=1 Tax=Mesorhizobium sp. M8A.F.Ca.ET.198.01.1.1 TaxID=2563966 RepID=UPI0024798A2A|nr:MULTISPECIES: SDR family oxidoreductase [unclassified Mesorhizobium]
MGRATALAFARAGASVALADIDQAGCEGTAQLIRDVGGSALVLRCDVTLQADIKSALSRTVSELGGPGYRFQQCWQIPEGRAAGGFRGRRMA